MTWSIIARDEGTGRIGIAVATRFFAVGALVPHIRTGVGAVASQALVNPYYGPRGLALLEAGARAEEVVARLTVDDHGRDHRQLHAMDRDGGFAAYTGAACVASPSSSSFCPSTSWATACAMRSTPGSAEPPSSLRRERCSPAH